MRVLMVGAGGVGGLFGGRLLEAGRDVTFLVRPARAARLAETGLVIKSPLGDANLRAPTVTAQALRDPYDLIVLSCKAYDLDAAIADIAPAVGSDTTILPLLNGMAHLDRLDARFGAERVLGGQCQLSAALDAVGAVIDIAGFALLVFGERPSGLSPRTAAILDLMQGAKFDARASDVVLLDMWEKWVSLAAVAGMTCLMRAPIGDIVAAGGAPLTLALLDEAVAVAAAHGFAPRDQMLTFLKDLVTKPQSPIAASMLRDIERHGPTEGEHILGDFLRRAGNHSGSGPLLQVVTTHLRTYEARLAREGTVSNP
jgi:2-dehydropantoate 2-reductase